MENPALRISSRVKASLLVACVFSFVLVFTYFDTAWSMVAIWSRSDTFAHGFLIVPISLWLVWIRRDHLWITETEPALWVALLMVFPAAAWVVAWLVDVDVIKQLALVSMLIVSAWTILGHKLARLLAFPLLFLFFAVPMGEGLIPPMMEFTATSTIWLIELTGIPVYREGLQFSLPSGYWSIVEACSGVRYIIASVTVGTLYAYLTYRSLWRRGVFVLVSLVVPVFANTLRAFIIVMLGHFSGMTIATGADHLVYGWVFFGLVIFLLFWLGSFFSEDEVPAPQTAPRADASAVPAGATRTRMLLAILLVLGISAIGPLVATRGASDAALNSELVLALPAPQPGWERQELRAWYWKPPSRVRGKESAYYAKDDFPLGLTVQYNDGRSRRADVLGSSAYLAEWDSGSIVAARAQVDVTIQGELVLVDEARIAGVDDDLLVWSWYNIGGLSTSNAYLGKLQQALVRFGFGERGTYRIVLATPVQSSLQETREFLQGYLRQHGSALYDELYQAPLRESP